MSAQTTTPSAAEPAEPAGQAGGKRQAPGPLLPDAARRPAAVIAICCAVVVLILAVLVVHSSGPDAVDRAVDGWLRARLGRHERLLLLLIDPGEPIQSTMLTAAITAACLAARRLQGAVLTVVSALLASVVAELLLKPIVHRTLGTFVVYPSGHTCRAFALATIIVVLLLNPPKLALRPAVKIAVAAVLFLAGCAVAVGVICLNLHYFTDTIGGAALGICVVTGTAFVLDTARVRSGMARLAGAVERRSRPRRLPSKA